MGGKKTVENSRRFEKDRRDKLNVAFSELCKLLPDHDPSITLSKMEILRRAADYIKYLQEQNEEIMRIGEDLALKNESEKLKKRVAHLLLKTKELVDALRSAGVPIPTSKRRKKKPKAMVKEPPSANQNDISDSKPEEAKTSKDEATTIKKVKCGCMKLQPEKRPLKESNTTVTSVSSVASLGSVTSMVPSSTSMTSPPWSKPGKLLTVALSATGGSVITPKIQNVPILKQLLPNTSKNASPIPSTLTGGTTLLPSLKSCTEGMSNSKNLTVIRNGMSSLPIVSPAIQTIPIIGNKLLTSNIVKEVTTTVFNKKNVSVVTSTSSNVVPTQTIINTPHIITLSQSNIISTPVVTPGMQTVPVLEKNLISNLGPGTLILADGRIMNVPPVVPQILVKPQPTVILMPTTKKKEKTIIPKKRDVTKTTFANKAPIPAIQAFRLESCPRVRPKKKSKALLKKSEESKSPENVADSEQVRKKRKIDNANEEEGGKIVLPSVEISNKKEETSFLSVSSEKPISNYISVNGSDCLMNKDNIDPSESEKTGDHESIGDSPDLSKSINNSEISAEQNNYLPGSVLSITELNTVSIDSVKTSEPVIGSSVVIRAVVTQPVNSLISSVQENSSTIILPNSDSHKNIDKFSSTEPNAKGMIEAQTDSINFNSNTSQSLLAISSTSTKKGENDTNCINGNDCENNRVVNVNNHTNCFSNTAETLKNSSESGINNDSLIDLNYQTSQSEGDAAYSSITEGPNVPATNASIEVSLFVSREKDVSQTDLSKNSSPQQCNDIHLDTNFTKEKSGNIHYQPPEEVLNSQVSAQESALPLSDSNSKSLTGIYSDTCNSQQIEGDQYSKSGGELESLSISVSSQANISTSTGQEKLYPSQEAVQSDLPDLGSNTILENSSSFPQVSELTQSLSLSGHEKIVYSLASSFQQGQNAVDSNAIIVTNNSLRTTDSKGQPISDAPFNEEKVTLLQFGHSEVDHSKQKSSQAMDSMYSNSQRHHSMVYSQSNTAVYSQNNSAVYSQSNSMVYSQSNTLLPYLKTSESNSTCQPTYEVPGTLFNDKNSSLIYTSNITKSVNFDNHEKIPCSSFLPLMSSVNQGVSSNSNVYPGYCSSELYPAVTPSVSQNLDSVKSVNKLTNTLSDNNAKKGISYNNSFNNSASSGRVTDKNLYNQNVPFHHNSSSKPNWEKSNCNKMFYTSSGINSKESSNTKDQNSSFQFVRTNSLEKQNESDVNNQIMCHGFQNETNASHASSFFHNFPTSTILQTSCGFSDIPSGIVPSSSIKTNKTVHENLLVPNSSSKEKYSQEKSFNNSQIIIDKGISAPSVSKDDIRNVSFYPATSQPPDRLVFTNSCTDDSPSQNNSFEINSVPKNKKSSESNMIQKNPCGETQKSISSNNNTIQKTSHRGFNNSINAAPFVDANEKIHGQNSSVPVDERRKVNDIQNSYSQDNGIMNGRRFVDNAKSITCLPSETAKTHSSAQYPARMIEKESIVQASNNISSKNLGTSITERNQETIGYSNYIPKPSTNGAVTHNIHSEVRNISHKINELSDKTQGHYKDYITDSNNEKHAQENTKLLPPSSTHKSVSTEMSSDDFQNFNFNVSNYQKTLPQNTSFHSNSSGVPGTPVRSSVYSSFDNIPFDPISNQYNNDNGIGNTNRSVSVYSAQGSNLPLQPLSQVASVSVQVPSAVNKTTPRAVMTNALPQKENHTSKIGLPSDGSYKVDIAADFLKSKDLERNTFIPIIDDVRLTSDFSSDLFSSLQVPTGGQHSESISPTAAFLLAFPLVSTSRNIENLPDNENHDNQTSTPTTILQIGNIEPPNTEMFQPIEYQKNKGNDHFEINNEYIHLSDIHGKQNGNYNKTCEKRKDVFTNFNKDQRAVESKGKSKSSAVNNSYSIQTYSYSNFSCSDYQQYCEKESSQWQQEFPNISKEQKKTCEKKNDKGVQKGNFSQNYQEFYNYKDKKRKRQNRISVNWMTTQENREQSSEYQPKETEVPNNYPGQSSQSVYSSNPIDFPTESFSDFCNPKRTNNYSWSPNKTLLPALDTHLMIPSTLPTLVGDLALGTSTPSESYKTFEPPKVPPGQGQPPNKKPIEKDADNKKQNEFPKSQGNLFSVSQLVDPKSKKQKTTDRNYRRLDKASKARTNFNCSKRKDDHCMYHEERNYLSNQNHCPEKRHPFKGGSYSAESLIGVQQTEVDFSSNFTYQQNSNYFQSEFPSHIDSNQQYGYFQQSHFSGFPHEEYQDFGFGANQRGLDQSRQKIAGRKDDNYQGTGLLQPQLYPSYSKSVHYNLPSSQLNTNTTTTLTNFNLSTIFPEMNDQRVASSGQTSSQMNPSSFPSSSQTYRNHMQQ